MSLVLGFPKAIHLAQQSEVRKILGETNHQALDTVNGSSLLVAESFELNLLQV